MSGRMTAICEHTWTDDDGCTGRCDAAAEVLWWCEGHAIFHGEAVPTLVARIADLEKCNGELDKYKTNLLKTFAHIHVRRQDDRSDMDTCAKCGWDIRSDIHSSAILDAKS